MSPLCEFCGKTIIIITSPKQRFHGETENPECFKERHREYRRNADRRYYKRHREIIKSRKGLGTGSIGAKRSANISEEIIKIQKERKRLGLIKEYNRPISYISKAVFNEV